MTLKSKLQGRAPKSAIILGSALGDVVDIVADPLVIPYTDLPGFPVPKISGHAGKLYVGKRCLQAAPILTRAAAPT
jgi:purine-nucleoside phosphorylase